MKNFKLSDLIFESLKEYEIEWRNEYPDIHDTEDLLGLIENPKNNFELNYKEKQEMIQRAKKIIHYSRNGFVLCGSNFLSIEEIYQEALIVAEHCDIPTCRRAILEVNKDKKIREKIEVKLSQKVKKDLEIREINKGNLSNKFEIKTGLVRVSFD